MKKLLLATTAIILLGGTAALSAEHEASKEGYYVRGDLGVHNKADGSATGTSRRGTKTYGIGDSTGGVASLAIGKEVYPNVRTEVEIEYSNSDADITKTRRYRARTGKGDLDQYSIGVNGLYDFKDTNEYVDFFAGGGVGVMNTHLDSDYLSGSDTTYFYKAIVGASRDIDEDWSTQVSLTHRDGSDYKIDGYEFDNSDQSIKVGLTRKF